MTLINSIITFTITIAGLSGAIIFIGRRVIDKTLEAGLENYKFILDKDLESHKANLQIIGLEHQISYNKLHEERGQSIKELYSLLVDLQNNLKYYTSIFQGPDWTTDQEREKNSIDTFNKLSNYFQKNRIYYPDNICLLVDELLPNCWEIIVKMSLAKNKGLDASTGTERIEAKDKWLIINKIVETEIEDAKNKIEKEFKKLLGVL